MKIYLVGGKGGVGKTTIAGFLSILLSERGDVLLLSTDLAHSLKDFFSIKKKGKRIKIRPSLWIFEPDIEKALKNYIGDIDKKVRENFSPTIYEDIKPFLKFSSQDPANYDLVLFNILSNEIIREEHDFMVVDTAATAQILKFATLPDRLLRWYDLLIKWRKKYVAMREMAKLNVGEEKLLPILLRKKEKMEKVKKELAQADFIWVLEPARLAFDETEKALKNLKGKIKLSALVMNKVSGKKPSVFDFPSPSLVEIPLFESEPLAGSPEGEKISAELKKILT